eukprot:Skav231774  [mRNA]  locus=scaffold3283:80189:81688:+ [translate_table: standard]
MSSLCEFLKLVPEFLARKPEKRAALHKEILDKMRKETWTADLKSLVMHHLQNPPRTWNERELAEFELAIDTVPSGTNPHRGRVQDFTQFPYYIHASLWKQIQDSESDFQKAQRICEHLYKLGLRTVSEKMAAHVMTFTLVASNKRHDEDTEEDLKQMYKQTKKLLQMIVCSRKQNDDIVHWSLPEDPAQFDVKVMTFACGDEQPLSPPPVDPRNMRVYESRFRVRPRKPIEGPMDATQLSALEAMKVAKRALDVVAGQHRSPDTIKLKMLTSPGRGQRGNYPLDLSERAPRKPLALPYLARDSSEVKSVQDVKQEQSSEENQHQYIPEKVSEGAIVPADPKQQEPHAASAYPHEEQISSQQDPQHLLGAGAALNGTLHTPTRTGGKFPLSARKKPASATGSSSLKRPASALESSPENKPACQMFKSPMKKVCKTSTAALKRPATQDTSSASKPVVDLVDKRSKVLISAKERLRKYPRGCSKCRQRRGCTRSCFIGRKEI